MSDFWTVIGAIAGVLGIVIGAFAAGVKRGAAKSKRALNDDWRKAKFSKIYAPAYALFLTRHITTCTGRGAPYFRQRLKNAKELLFEEGRLVKAFKALFDKQELEEDGEVEYGGSFPLKHITDLVESNSQYADSELCLLVARANRAQYEEYEGNGLLTVAELQLFYHIANQHRKLSREYADV
ncbi:MAG: hypothetical protein JRI67_11855 [Deltaproteobacteria bacterium]|nr:hypothetical protein [Deltaproteobacteria bacterium]